MTPIERLSVRNKALSLLGVSGQPTKSELRKAYRKLAFEKHPDHGRASADEFAQISEAYSLLVDEATDDTMCRVDPYTARRVSRPSVRSIKTEFDDRTMDACETAFDGIDTVGQRHLANALHRKGRILVYSVNSMPKVGVNHVALPTGDLVDTRHIKPVIVDVWSGDVKGMTYNVPAQTCAKLFPGARAVQIRFGTVTKH